MIASIRGMRPSFFSVLVAAFLIGAVLRIGPQIVVAGHDQSAAEAASVPSYVVINSGDESPAPRNAEARAAVDFYRAVINGSFDRAYDLSLENRWADSASSAPRVVGIEPRNLFVSALNDEIGSEGIPVGIARLAVEWERPLHLTSALRHAYPELLTLQHLPSSVQAAALSEAHVSGKLVGNCAISGFARTDVMAKVDGRWKVLLPGRQRHGDPHFEEWFLPHTHFHAVFRGSGG